MPNDNKLPNTGDDQQVNQSNPTTPMDSNSNNDTSNNLPPIMVSEESLPPMPNMSPEPVTINSVQTEEPKKDTLDNSPVDAPISNSGSAAPTNDIIDNTVMPAVVTSTPKKKFAGGKVIATILGLFLLVGGIGAGVFLTGQNQNINEKAAPAGTCVCQNANGTNAGNGICSGSSCTCGTGLTVKSNACGENPGGGTGVGGSTTTIVSCSTTNSVQCGVTPSGCGGFCILPVDKTCDQMLQQECNFTPVRGANYKTGYASKADCPSGYQSAWCSCGGANVCFDRGFDESNGIQDQCGGTDGLCAVWVSSQTSGGPGGVACGTVNTYYCANVDYTKSGKSCDTSTGGTTTKPANFCGTIQTDTACQGFKSTYVPCSTATTPPSISAKCQNIKAYSETWTLLTATDLSNLKAVDKVNFCVTGSATSGAFDKAKLTINGVVQAETTSVRPSSTDFCQLYTIPAATTTFNLTAQIHHASLGWK